MRTLAILAAAVVGLAACDRQAPAAGKAPGTAAAEGGKAPAVEPFRSAVTPKPAPGSAQAADAALSSKVKSALQEAPDIRPGALEVASSDGVVTLYGTVDAPVEKDRAAMLAMEVEGVRSVVNNLVVVKGAG